MAVKAGYKQTEVGVIPEDWEVKLLGEITEPSRPISYGIVQTGPNISNGIRCLRVLDIEGGRIKKSDLITTTKAISDSYKRTILKAGDLVTPLRGKVGEVALVDNDLNGANLTRGVALIAMRNEFHPLFFKHCLSSPKTKKRLEQSMNGSALQEIPIATLRSFKVAYPPVHTEQTAIATALSDADGLIEALEQLICKKRNIKKGAMQELLTGKKRLPGFSGEWEVKRLGDLGTCHRGVSYNPTAHLTAYDTDSTIRLLRSNNVQESKIIFENMQFVDSSRVSDVQKLRLNDILICMANGSKALVGKSGRFEDSDGFEYTFGAFMGCFRPDVHLANSDYVFFIFQTEKYKQHIDVLLAGSSINNLRPSEVESLQIVIPLNREEQSAIATILSDMDVEITALEEKLKKARHIKQGMMQELLTGRIRLV